MSEEQTERFQMRISPEMLDRVDEWRRLQPVIPNRSEAIRRLTSIGLALSDREEKLAEILKDTFVTYYGIYSTITDKPESAAPELRAQIEALGQPIDQFFRLVLLLEAENLPMKQTADIEEALAQVKDLRSRMKDFTRASLPGDPPPKD